MQENKITNTFYLLLISIIMLSLVSYVIPQDFIDAYGIRKVDYWSPLVKKEVKTIIDTVLVVNEKGDTVKTVVVTSDTATPPPRVKREIVTIEDYSSDSSQLSNFVMALKSVKDSSEKCRIAFYGDSFIEGDILTMNLRSSLQKEFGGNGVGFLPISSEVSGFRRSLPSESKDWKTYSVANQSKAKEYGIAGSSFVPSDLESSFLTLKPSKNINGIYLYYKSIERDVPILMTFNKKKTKTDTLRLSDKVSVYTISKGSKDTVRNCKISIKDTSGIIAYGVSVENGRGVYLDNFSIRGNSGLGLNQIKDGMFREFQQHMDYKLIVLQFGINVSAPENNDFGFYETAMVKMINRLKRVFPQSSFLLVSIGDRSYKKDDEYVTMPSIPILVESQRNIAKKTGIMFWNMFEAMGWENGMVKLVDANMGNKDYTHISFGGGNLIAKELYKAIMYAYNKKTNDYGKDSASVH